jgi:hypothetical protein
MFEFNSDTNEGEKRPEVGVVGVQELSVEDQATEHTGFSAMTHNGPKPARPDTDRQTGCRSSINTTTITTTRGRKRPTRRP